MECLFLYYLTDTLRYLFAWWFTAPTVSWFPAEFTILPAYRNSFSFAIIRFCPDSIHCLLLNISPFRPRWIVIVPIVVLVLVIDEGNSTVKTHNTTRIAHNAVWLYINVSCLHDCLIYWEKSSIHSVYCLGKSTETQEKPANLRRNSFPLRSTRYNRGYHS